MVPTVDTRRPVYPAIFAVMALTVLAVSRYAVLRPDAPAGIGIAVALDLSLFVPLLYYLLLVRGMHWPAPSTFAVMFVMTLVAPLVYAGALRPEPRFLQGIAVAAELALLASLVQSFRRAGRALGMLVEGDRLERFRAAAAAAVGENRGADILAYEAAVLWHALFSWRRSPAATRSPDDTFTVHEKSGYGGIVVALILAIAAESVPMHMLVSRASVVAAWIVTVLGIYGAVWLVGDLRAARFRPVELRQGRLLARVGLRWTLDADIGRVRSARRLKPGQPREAGILRMALPGSRLVRIQFDQPVTARGPYGVRRTIEAIDLGLDEPDRFIARLGDQLEGRLIS
jgi:hypothetical protein